MSEVILSQIDPQILINDIADLVTKKVLTALAEKNVQRDTESPNNPINEYIPKHEVANTLASQATLWKYEKQGKLKVYGVGGKRYYKRTDIENLFQPLN